MCQKIWLILFSPLFFLCFYQHCISTFISERFLLLYIWPLLFGNFFIHSWFSSFIRLRRRRAGNFSENSDRHNRIYQNNATFRFSFRDDNIRNNNRFKLRLLCNGVSACRSNDERFRNKRFRTVLLIFTGETKIQTAFGRRRRHVVASWRKIKSECNP